MTYRIMIKNSVGQETHAEHANTVFDAGLETSVKHGN